MRQPTTKPDSLQPATELAVDLFDNWFDPIEAEVRARSRQFIEELIRGELDDALARPRYGRSQMAGNEAKDGVSGYRHGSRTRSLTGTFGPIEIAVPRARLTTSEGKTTEWKSRALRAYQRRTLAADALIASSYLAGTNTRRVRRALAALFGGTVGKDTVSRTWRKVKSDWDAWNSRSLAEEPIVRLILDGTVVRVRLDRKATSISLLVVLGVRADGQKVLLAISSMGGESAEAWRMVAGRSHQARDQASRVPHRRRRAGARQSHCRRLGRRAGATLHGPQAQKPARARSRAPARGDHRGLQ
jgi:transposase-like protein